MVGNLGGPSHGLAAPAGIVPLHEIRCHLRVSIPPQIFDAPLRHAAASGDGAELRLKLCVDLCRRQVEHKFFGLQSELVLVVQQPRLPAYCWDAAQGAFVSQRASTLRAAGDGYALMQLAWPGQARSPAFTPTGRWERSLARPSPGASQLH